MKIETKYDLGQKVVAMIDGAFCGGDISKVQVFYTLDHDKPVITYAINAARKLPPDIAKRAGYSIDRRELLENEATLEQWHADYQAREQRLKAKKS